MPARDRSLRRPPAPPLHEPSSGAAIGARLRRLSARVDREASEVYRALELDFDFEQRWYGVFEALSRSDALSVQQLAVHLGLTHPAVSQVRKALEERGLVRSVGEVADGRRTLLSLTARGRGVARRLRPTWDALNIAAAALNEEVGDVAALLDRLEAALDRKPLSDRVCEARARVPRVRGGSAVHSRKAARVEPHAPEASGGGSRRSARVSRSGAAKQ